MAKPYTSMKMVGRDGKPVMVYLWQPETAPRGVLQVIHGMKEHMARYDDFAQFLTAQGYVVCGHDHPGHGRSGGQDAHLGYFGEDQGAKLLLQRCRQVTGMLTRQYPELPLFLLGHSMGSFLGRLCVLHQPEVYQGFLCMGTGGERRMASVGRVLAEALVRIQGGQTEGRFLDRLTFHGYNKRCTLDGESRAWLSRDPDVVAAYVADPLTYPYFTNAGYRDLYELQMAATSKAWVQRVDKMLPILLVSGKEDPVGGYGKDIVQLYEQLMLAGAQDVTCQLYEGARHELLNEMNREEIYYDLYTWMEKRR